MSISVLLSAGLCRRVAGCDFALQVLHFLTRPLLVFLEALDGLCRLLRRLTHRLDCALGSHYAEPELDYADDQCGKPVSIVKYSTQPQNEERRECNCAGKRECHRDAQLRDPLNCFCD